jgi:histidyl-tRNA synthetase
MARGSPGARSIPVVEAEVCAAVSDALLELGFKDFTIRINHRQLLTSILNFVAIPEPLHGTALVTIDKLDKIGPDGVKAEMESRGIARDSATRLIDVFGTFGTDEGKTSSQLDPAGIAAFENIAAIFRLAGQTSAGPRLQFDASLARGLSYYTGAIMEINVPDLAGSLGGGGRYDNLVGMFLGQSVPACGFSLGLERILVVMGERGMFPPSLATTPADVMVAVFDANDAPHALRVAQILRASGLRAMVYPDADKIGKQIKYADTQRIPYVAILGGDEIAKGTVTVKHLTAQTQNTYDQAAAGAAILEGLKQRG